MVSLSPCLRSSHSDIEVARPPLVSIQQDLLFPYTSISTNPYPEFLQAPWVSMEVGAPNVQDQAVWLTLSPCGPASSRRGRPETPQHRCFQELGLWGYGCGCGERISGGGAGVAVAWAYRTAPNRQPQYRAIHTATYRSKAVPHLNSPDSVIAAS